MKRSRLRFLWIVKGPAPFTVVIAVALLAFAAYLQWSFPDGIDQAFAIALFLQLFSASTGYVHDLRQGHFDPCLVGGRGRWGWAMAHWTVSVALGATAWVLLGIIAAIGVPPHRPLPFTAAGAAAMLYASTAVWTVSLRGGRYAGAVLWLVILFALAATQHLQALRVGFNPAATTWLDAMRAAGASLVFPGFLLINPAVVSNHVVVLVVIATCGVWVLGAWVVCRLDAVLERS